MISNHLDKKKHCGSSKLYITQGGTVWQLRFLKKSAAGVAVVSDIGRFFQGSAAATPFPRVMVCSACSSVCPAFVCVFVPMLRHFSASYNVQPSQICAACGGCVQCRLWSWCCLGLGTREHCIFVRAVWLWYPIDIYDVCAGASISEHRAVTV